MLFVDYHLEVNQGRILFDKELTAEKLGLREGDEYIVTIEDGQVVLIKME
jgi:formylmethanofuran dehydrogenase subunit D